MYLNKRISTSVHARLNGARAESLELRWLSEKRIILGMLSERADAMERGESGSFQRFGRRSTDQWLLSDVGGVRRCLSQLFLLRSSLSRMSIAC